MDIIRREDLRALLHEQKGPFVSLYLPTHRSGSEQDPIRLRNLLAEVQSRMRNVGWRGADVKELLEPARALLDDPVFWKHQGDGLAIFLAPEFERVYRLPVTFAEHAVLAAHFLVTPLLPLLTNDGRFFVLALSQNAVRLLQGTRQRLSEVSLRDVPQNLAEALRTHDRDEILTYHSRPTSGGTWGAIFSGQGVGIDDKKSDLLSYFQKVDRGLHAVVREEKAPLMLAAVDYLLPIYRQGNTYPHLLDKAIEGNPDHLSADELHERAWALLRPHFEEVAARAIGQYRRLVGTGRTATGVNEVVAAAHDGQVETLFVSADVPSWGRLATSTGRVIVHPEGQPGDEDLVNLAAIHTLRHGGAVFTLASAEAPGETPLAAIYRLPLAKHGKRPGATVSAVT